MPGATAQCSPPPSGRRAPSRSWPPSVPPAPPTPCGCAARRDPPELALARALGAEWLDRYLTEWRAVSLEIGGEDLIEAGVPEGPAVGRGLAAALRMKLDGELAPGRAEELAAAVAAAGSDDGVA